MSISGVIAASLWNRPQPIWGVAIHIYRIYMYGCACALHHRFRYHKEYQHYTSKWLFYWINNLRSECECDISWIVSWKINVYLRLHAILSITHNHEPCAPVSKRCCVRNSLALTLTHRMKIAIKFPGADGKLSAIWRTVKLQGKTITNKMVRFSSNRARGSLEWTMDGCSFTHLRASPANVQIHVLKWKRI